MDHIGNIYFTRFFVKIILKICRLRIFRLRIFKGTPFQTRIIPLLMTDTTIKKGRYLSYGYY